MTLATRAKTLLQSTLRAAGYELRRVASSGESIDGSAAMFRYLRGVGPIRTVIDIGANDGAFLEFLQRFFAAEKSIAFEPLPAAQATLEARGIPGLTLFPHALSDASGTTRFEVNAYGPSSSMLALSDLSRREFPQTAQISETIEVPVARLDDLVDSASLAPGVFVKMDVQGVEDKVIAGGQAVLAKADFILVEVSFQPIYENQVLFEEVHAPLAALGFRFAGMKNQLSASSGEPLFGHVLYRRSQAT
jgi:FkbM family methyltransferase